MEFPFYKSMSVMRYMVEMPVDKCQPEYVSSMEKSCLAHWYSGTYLFKVKSGNTRTMCETYSKLTIKTPERSPECRFGICY